MNETERKKWVVEFSTKQSKSAAEESYKGFNETFKTFLRESKLSPSKKEEILSRGVDFIYECIQDYEKHLKKQQELGINISNLPKNLNYLLIQN
jgi:hypothetical protein